ncbi:MAG: type II toxin-antitoxin system YoeB family toxin [Deltaproteobacteria bacterium]|nr:type II toxin-antitoxin system YoeB family toxin [Deltaproteobacteria bacterium]
MRLSFHEDAWADYLYWQENDRKVLRRINELIRDAL